MVDCIDFNPIIAAPWHIHEYPENPRTAAAAAEIGLIIGIRR